MEQRLNLYRRHARSCAQGYTTDDRILENDTRPDCTCGIVAAGKLAGETKRILHRATGTNDWREARRIRDLWLEWGHANQGDPLLSLQDGNRVTIDQAIQQFFLYSQQTFKRGNSATEKYETLFNSRLRPWCKAKGIKFIAEFDDRQTVVNFFYSWHNLQPVRGKTLKANDPLVELSINTKRAELERYRTFLGFCQSSGWLKANYAKKPHITLNNNRVAHKIAWTLDEYDAIEQTFRDWKDEYGRPNSPKAIMQYAFVLMLRYTGQRISDVAMATGDPLPIWGEVALDDSIVVRFFERSLSGVPICKIVPLGADAK